MFAPGTYWLDHVTCGVGESDKGTPYFWIEGDVAQTADGQQVLHPERRTIFAYLSDAARGYTMNKLERLGFNGDFENPALSVIEADGGIWAECRHEVYEGSPREKWELPGGSIRHAALDADMIRKLNAIWRSRHQQPAAPARPAASKPPAAKPPPSPSKAARPPAGMTADEAWKEAVRLCSACTTQAGKPYAQEDIEAAWWAARNAVCPGIDDADVTTAQWAKIAADTPNHLVPF